MTGSSLWSHNWEEQQLWDSSFQNQMCLLHWEQPQLKPTQLEPWFWKATENSRHRSLSDVWAACKYVLFSTLLSWFCCGFIRIRCSINSTVLMWRLSSSVKLNFSASIWVKCTSEKSRSQPLSNVSQMPFYWITCIFSVRTWLSLLIRLCLVSWYHTDFSNFWNIHKTVTSTLCMKAGECKQEATGRWITVFDTNHTDFLAMRGRL